MIAEPVTTITDLILAGESFLLGHLLFWNDSRNFVRSWALGFLFLGFAALFGAIAHGAAPYMENIPSLLLTWPATIFAIVTTSLFLHVAWIEEFSTSYKKILLIFVGIVSVFFYLHIFGFLNILTPTGNLTFMVAILSYAPAILLQLILNLARYAKTRRLGYSLMCNGILLSILGTLIQVFKIAPHENFNHNDLYHVIQMASLFILYKGIRNK